MPFITACASNNIDEPSSDVLLSVEPTAVLEESDFDRKWYDEVITGFKLEDISKSMETANAVVEYRIVHNVALLGYYYYSLQVFDDGTGKFFYKVHKSENFVTGKLLLNETKQLSKEETQNLLDVINNNDFWNIPTIHPDDEAGCDGETYFIEGCAESKRHFIRMWEPKAKHEIYKIANGFREFSQTITKEPEMY